MMDVSHTVIPKSDQINFEDVQSQDITAVIKSVRTGTHDQPVFIDLEGFDGRPYKPSKSMRRVLVEAWGNNGHAWAGYSLTLYGDPLVKFGGVAVGGIKIRAMSHIDADFSLMLSVSRGKRQEHRVCRLDIKPRKSDDRTPDELLAGFSDYANKAATAAELDRAYHAVVKRLAGCDELTGHAADIYHIRRQELEGNVQA